MPASHATPARTADRAKVGRLSEAVQMATGESVEASCLDRGQTGEKPAQVARERAFEPEMVRLSKVGHGFVPLLPPGSPSEPSQPPAPSRTRSRAPAADPHRPARRSPRLPQAQTGLSPCDRSVAAFGRCRSIAPRPVLSAFARSTPQVPSKPETPRVDASADVALYRPAGTAWVRRRSFDGDRGPWTGTGIAVPTAVVRPAEQGIRISRRAWLAAPGHAAGLPNETCGCGTATSLSAPRRFFVEGALDGGRGPAIEAPRWQRWPATMRMAAAAPGSKRQQ